MEFAEIYRRYIEKEITPLEATILHWELTVSTGGTKASVIPKGISIKCGCFLCEPYINLSIGETKELCKDCPISIKEGGRNIACEREETPYRTYCDADANSDNDADRAEAAVEFVKYLKELRSENE